MFPSFEFIGKTVPLYGVCLMLGFLVPSVFACLRARRRGLNSDNLIIIIAIAFLLAMIGAKLFYVFFSYGVSNAVSDILRGDFSNVFGGGLVFFGGLIGGVLGAFIAAKFLHTHVRGYATCVAPFIPLGHAFGRVGCFLAGCCYGIRYDGPLAVHYPHSIFGLDPANGYFPVQLLEAALNVLLFICLFFYTKKERGLRPLCVYGIAYGIERFSLEYLCGDEIRGKYLFLTSSQWVSVGVILLCAIALVLIAKHERKAAG